MTIIGQINKNHFIFGTFKKMDLKSIIKPFSRYLLRLHRFFKNHNFPIFHHFCESHGMLLKKYDRLACKIFKNFCVYSF